jgi:RNA polymerase sigma factor (sigma-70 family)
MIHARTHENALWTKPARRRAGQLHASRRAPHALVFPMTLETCPLTRPCLAIAAFREPLPCDNRDRRWSSVTSVTSVTGSPATFHISRWRFKDEQYVVATFVHFRLNAFMTPPQSTDPASSAAFQTVTLTKELGHAAKEVTSQHRILSDDLGQRTTTDVVAYFGFQSENQAKRGELLLCKILARSNPAVVNEVINDFQSSVDLVLNPVLNFLIHIEEIAPKEDSTKNAPIIGKIQLVRQGLTNSQNEAAKMVNEFRHQKESESWGMIANTWVNLNLFLIKMASLRIETQHCEIEWNSQPEKIKTGRPHTTPIANAQFGPVMRTESEVRVSFDLFLNSWPHKFCQTIADTDNFTCPFPSTAAVMDLILIFDELFHQCGSLKCDLLDDERFHPNKLLDIESRFKDFIGSQGAFCKQMQVLPNCAIISGADIRSAGKQARADIEAGASMLGPMINDLNKTLGKVTEVFADPLVAAARDASINKGVPSEFVWWVLMERHLGKFPTTDHATYKSGLGPNLKSTGHPFSRATVNRWLVIISNELIKRKLMQPRRPGRNSVKAPNNDVGQAKDPNLISGNMEEPPDKEPPKDDPKETEEKGIPGQESDEPEDGSDSKDPAATSDPAKQAEAAERKHLLDNAIKKLPQKYRNVVIDKYINNLTPQEIADNRGMNIDDVEQQIESGLTQLKKTPELAVYFEQ